MKEQGGQHSIYCTKLLKVADALEYSIACCKSGYLGVYSLVGHKSFPGDLSSIGDGPVVK